MPRVRRAPLPAVVLGVCPAVAGAPAWAPDSASGRRLARLAGCEPEELGRLFALDNLLGYPAPPREAPKDAENLFRLALKEAGARYEFLPGFRYLLAGTEVLRALGARALPAQGGEELPWALGRTPSPCEWYEAREGFEAAVLPHPSGQNRWYNDERCRWVAEGFLREAAWRGSAPAQGLWLTAPACAPRGGREKAGAR